MTFQANETTITLGNLNSSMLYKFYLSAHTIKGSGPIITEEAFTVMDTSKLLLPFSFIWNTFQAVLEEKGQRPISVGFKHSHEVHESESQCSDRY